MKKFSLALALFSVLIFSSTVDAQLLRRNRSCGSSSSSCGASNSVGSVAMPITGGIQSFGTQPQKLPSEQVPRLVDPKTVNPNDKSTLPTTIQPRPAGLVEDAIVARPQTLEIMQDRQRIARFRIFRLRR